MLTISTARPQRPGKPPTFAVEGAPALVDAFRAEHRDLLALFAELEQACARGDADACRTVLARFAALLQAHLHRENLQLYGHFAQHPHPNQDVARQVDNISADMMRVGAMLQRFVCSHATAASTSEYIAPTTDALRAIGEVFAHRIHEEEAVLFPLFLHRAA